MSTDRLIVVPLGTDLLALTEAEYAAARARAAQLGLAAQVSASQVEPLVDSTRMAEIAGVPEGWIAEAARQGRIPSIVAGKYRRFRPSAVVAALSIDRGVTANERHPISSSKTRAKRASP